MAGCRRTNRAVDRRLGTQGISFPGEWNRWLSDGNELLAMWNEFHAECLERLFDWNKFNA